MKPYRMICLMLLVFSPAVLAGCARVLPSPPKPAVDLTAGMEFVPVKGGCYSMGDTFGDGDKDEKPVHEVCVSDFHLGKFEVTQGQWERVMGSNPSANKECGADCPVDSVNWSMVREFIGRLNSATGRQYRLPTEAEWEYAARSGGKAEKWAGTSDEAALAEFAWFEKNSGLTTHRVGLKKANGLGLHDMSGNVAEWCQDWYGETYYEGSPRDNPQGPAAGEKRVLRGGSWVYDSGVARAAKRSSDGPAEWDSNYGFRLVSPGP